MLTKNRNEVLSLLLTGARIIDLQVIEQAYASVDRLDAPLNKVLVMLGHVSQFKMDRVLQAESMIRDNELSPDTAIKALRLATSQQLSFEDALAALGDEHKKTQLLPTLSNEITSLLLEAAVINNDQIVRALKVSLENGMQMGRVLLFHRDVTPLMMKAAIVCCMLKQEEKIDQMSALRAIELVKKTNMTIEEVLFRYDIYPEESGQGPKLYELFAMAGFISESDLMECLELHVLRGRQIGQIFIEQGLINHEVLENAIVLQGMIADNAIKAYQAAEALKNAHAKQISIYQALGELEPAVSPMAPSLSLMQLLVAANVVSQKTMESFFEGLELSSRQVAKKLLSANVLNDKNCVTALRCYSLNSEGFIGNRQCAEILRHCISYNASLDEQLADWGYFVPNRMHWIWK